MSLALGLFIACSNDEDSDEVLLTNEKLIRSDFEESAIIPSKTIPATIKARMDSIELDVFSKLSTIGYVDYSFFDTKYYAEKKQEILESLTRAYNKYVAEGKEDVYFSICPFKKSLDNLRALRITPTELGSHAVFLKNVTDGSFSFDFIVSLGVGNNSYSYQGVIVTESSVPSNYSYYGGGGHAYMTSGLSCTLSLDFIYQNNNDSTLQPVIEEENVLLNFPPKSN